MNFIAEKTGEERISEMDDRSVENNWTNREKKD